MRTCSIVGCEKPLLARGWCKNHYEHNRTYGTPHLLPKPTIEERLRARIVDGPEFEGTACWEWQGPRLPAGYGYISIDNRRHYTHRLAHELFVGPIPESHHVDHRCENKPCCNPDHLEAVLPIVNTRRHFSKVTHCPAGHPYDETNTRINAYDGGRQCRACDRERAVARRKAA